MKSGPQNSNDLLNSFKKIWNELHYNFAVTLDFLLLYFYGNTQIEGTAF